MSSDVVPVVDAEIVPSTSSTIVRSHPLDSVQLHLVDNMEETLAFFRWAGERRPEEVLGLDTETASLNPYGTKPLRMVQFGDMQQGWAIPWELWGGVALEMLQRWQGEWVLHNSRFDANWLRMATKRVGQEWQIDWSRTHDTLTQAHIDDPTRSRALKKLAGMLIDPRASSSQVVLEKEMNANNWDWDTVPITRTGAGSSYWIYAALDPVLTMRLHDHFTQTRITYREPYELEMGTIRCIANMEWRGARVDLPYCRYMTERIQEYSQQIRQWILDVFGIQNATSTAQCIAAFEGMGREITRFTAGGAKSLDKEQLQTFIIERGEDDAELPGTELARQLLILRKGEKQIGPYFSNFERLADGDSMVHPTIWPVGTRTARMSITDPALQTLPRGDPTVRDAFIPSDDNILILCDYDQIEMRLAAHFSQDEGLRRAFVESADFFNTVASDAWGDLVVKGDPRRQTMKNGCYGKLYGASVAKIALTAGVPLLTMQRVMAGFDSSYPGISRLQQAVIAAGQKRGREEGRPYVVTPTGRRLYGDTGKEYALTNYLIQSHAAEVLKRSICDMDAVGIGDLMILPVHDEVVFDVPRDDREEVTALIEKTMTREEYFVPLTCGVDVAESRWGDKYR